MSRYNHQSIEKKWQEYWEEHQTFTVADDSTKDRAYVLDMFPYPSAQGLHVGHPEGYTATDIYSRYLRMKGVHVLHPMGWDAFGLPAENFAIKVGKNPKEITWQNIENFRRQIKSLGLSYDWSREINTADPAYYKWTQWLFIKLYENGLAYQKEAPVNWCPSCQTVLANEQVVGGACERCHATVVQKQMKQWFFKITDYAEKLLQGLDSLDWPKPILEMQRNWIGKSEGALVKFQILIHQSADKFQIKVFTTRLDTIFGVTYLVLAPEHEMVQELKGEIKNWSAVETYRELTKKKTELDRKADTKEKTGVKLEGVMAINPANQEAIPIFIADYVLSTYGTGAIMAVPAHDSRDFEFAKKYNLPIRRVVEPKFISTTADGAPHAGEEFVKRNAVCAIVRNPKDDTYLCVSWKEFLMHGLVTGGVEEGEDIVTAAKREIHEETGYKNVRLVRDPQFALHSFFYHRVKKQNRWARFQYLFFELENEERDSIDAKENALHQVLWKSKSEFRDFFSVIEAEFILNFLNNPEYIHTGEGLLHNSGEFDNLDSTEAKIKIAEKIGAHFKTEYRLRDWLISRQRYWGTPIPIIYCEHCAESGAGKVLVPGDETQTKKPFVLIIHGTGSSSKINWYLWLANKLKARGYEVVVPDLPQSNLPVLEIWMQALDQYKNNFDERSIIIGHSLGAPTALQFLQRISKKVAKVVLVAPTAPQMDWGKIRATHDLEQFDHIHNFTEAPLDWKKLSSLSTEFIGIFSDNDRYIPLETKTIFENNLKARTQVFHERGHFSESSAGIVELPEFFEAVSIVNASKFINSGITVPENELPVELPDDVDFRPTGESPLVRSVSFHKVKCPKCGEKARRESDTMDTFVDSSWYFLRYPDPKNTEAIFCKDKVNTWCPVQLYVGGAEHAVLHLLYARFFTYVLFDLGLVDFKEPFVKLKNQGLILGEDGQKMSKSRGNVINPDEIVSEFGADTLRLYEMFMGPLEDAKPWSTKSMSGVRRFLDRVWGLVAEEAHGDYNDQAGNELALWQARTIKRVTEDIENFRFNTAISALMEYTNFLYSLPSDNENRKSALKVLVILLTPFAPHLSAELWHILGEAGRVWEESWPKYDEKILKSLILSITVQVNGKTRGTIEVSPEIGESEVVVQAQALPVVTKYLVGAVNKTIYVPGRLINFVVK